MTLQELKKILSTLNSKDSKKDYIAKNVTYLSLLDMFVELVDEAPNTDKVTVPQEIYDKLISLIEDNFRTPEGKGRGRKSIVDDDSLTFWEKVRKIKTSTVSTQVKISTLTKLVDRENEYRKENNIPLTPLLGLIVSAKPLDIDYIEESDNENINKLK